MLFNSFIFFIFLGVVLPIFYTLRSKISKNIFLLLASYFFYGYWDWRFLLLIAISTVIDYFIGHYLEKYKDHKKRKLLVALSLIANLGILGFFKYFNFFIGSFEDLFGANLDYLHLNIILPVGISFYTFQTLSYTIDIYRKRIKPTTNFIDFALFVAFFPQLVAGPIERASALLPQLSGTLKPTRIQIYQGVVLIVTGLFRKVIIGDTAGKYVDHIFSNIELYKSFELISALILFAIQIYADFSGYSKIARGCAKLLGVELMVNFKQPYLSRNITEFWRRWHISLSSWLKDYLYISLGGNRINVNRTYVNLMITMLLGGLWHGASWNFLIWGGLHGLYLAVHKFVLKDKKVTNKNVEKFSFRDIANIFLTNVLVIFSWLFFRSTTWESTKSFFNKMIYWESSEHSLFFLKVVLAYVGVVLILDLLEYKFRSQVFILKIKSKAFVLGLLSALFAFTLMYMFQSKTAPFIYFAF